jgi:sarcosine oxidase subunit beta
MTANIQDVVIIGGGISGAAAAYDLARSGATVTLVEKGLLASMASGWSLAGVRQSGRHPAEIPLAQAAVKRWETLNDELEADVEYRQEGNLRLARTAGEVDTIVAMVAEQQQLGLDLSFLPDNEAVRAVAPHLSDAVLAASYCPTDGHANPVATVHAFATAAERAGAIIRTQTAVTGIDVTGGRVTGVQTTAGPIAADVVVVAAGVYADRLCEQVGLPWPLAVEHVSAVQTIPLPPLLKQVLGVANADFAGRQEVNGRLRMTVRTGPWIWPDGDLTADDIQPPAHMVVTIINRASVVLPAVAAARLARVWGGLITMTPDGLPVIERSDEIEGLVIAGGFSGHGFCLGPITGQIVCELVTEGETSLPIEPFRRGRFEGMQWTARAELHG